MKVKGAIKHKAQAEVVDGRISLASVYFVEKVNELFEVYFVAGLYARYLYHGCQFVSALIMLTVEFFVGNVLVKQ